jgi:hypothetical protein
VSSIIFRLAGSIGRIPSGRLTAKTQPDRGWITGRVFGRDPSAFHGGGTMIGRTRRACAVGRALSK